MCIICLNPTISDMIRYIESKGDNERIMNSSLGKSLITRTFKCSNCPTLTRVPEEFGYLHELYCYNCPSLTHIFPVSCSSYIRLSCSLRILSCYNCPLITHIPEGLLELEKLICHNCPSLLEISEELVNLKYLDCRNCPLITRIPKELVKLETLSCDGCLLITYIPVTLIELEELWCDDCVSLTHIPKELVNLELISCRNCSLITHIPIELVKLEELRCSNCPLITLPDIPKISNKSNMIDKVLSHLGFQTRISSQIDLKALDCVDCPSITHIPKGYTHLKYLDVSGTNITEIHEGLVDTTDFWCEDCPNLICTPDHILDDEAKNMVESNLQQYRKKECKKFVYNILEELIQRTWEPTRAIDWCWDEEEKKFMMMYSSIHPTNSIQ